MGKKKLAFVSEDRHFNKNLKEILDETFEVSQFDNFIEAEKELSEKKFDIIYLEPYALPAGYCRNGIEIDINEVNKSISDRYYFGKKLLTDIIRNKNSVNFKTPVDVGIILLSLGPEWDYLANGADNVFIKIRDTYDKVADVMKEQVTAN